MKRKFFAGVGLVLVALSGCVPPPPPAQMAAVPIPVAPPPIVVVPPPVIVMQPPPVWTPMRHHVVRHRTVRVVQRVYHHWTHRYYATRAHYWSPRCGSDIHPCTVEQRLAPIQ